MRKQKFSALFTRQKENVFRTHFLRNPRRMILRMLATGTFELITQSSGYFLSPQLWDLSSKCL